MKILLLFLYQILLPVDNIRHWIDSLQNDDEVRMGTVAASIRSSNTGEYLLRYNDEKSLNSASTLKLVSTGVLLNQVGGDFRYSTFLEYDGSIKDSVLSGNIFIRGTGDPSLGAARIGFSYQKLLQLFVQKIKEAGIKQINGYVIGDGGIFPQKKTADTWIWGDIGNYYGAGVSGLNINENSYDVIFKSAKTVGSFAPVLRFAPDLPNHFFENKVFTAEKGSGDNVNIYASPLSNHLKFDGTIPSNVDEFSVSGSIMDPALETSYLLSQQLEETGITLQNSTISIDEFREKNGFVHTERKLLYKYDSPPLRQLIQYCNYESLNIYADAFLKMFGYATSRDASFEAAIKSVHIFLENKGVNLSGFMIKDGSGLSPSGVLTAKNLTDILYAFSKEKTFTDFYNSIPMVGVNGTVQYLCKGTNAVGKVRAKSGSIQSTRAYAGYFYSKNGELMSFTFLVNRFAEGSDKKVRKYLEKIITLLVEI